MFYTAALHWLIAQFVQPPFPPNVIPYKVGVGGISWPGSPMVAKSMPGIHTCLNKTVFYDYSWRENQVLLVFDESNKTSDGSYIYKHCSLPLRESVVAKWSSLISGEDELTYKFFVNDVYKLVPVREKDRVYSTFRIRIDPSSHADRPVFDVVPMDPVRLEYDPMVRVKLWNVTFYLKMAKIESGFEGPVKQEGMQKVLALASVMLLLPALGVVLLNKSLFVSVNTLTDFLTLPFFHQNLWLFTVIGVGELLRGALMVLFERPNAKGPFYAVNLGLIVLVPEAILRFWLGKLGYLWLSETEYTGFVYGHACVLVVSPIVAVIASRILFNSFRGQSTLFLCVLLGMSLLVVTVISRTIGYCLLWIWQNNITIFRLKDSPPASTHSIVGGVVYGAVGAAIIYPALEHFIGWVIDKNPRDDAFLFAVEMALTSYASFFGVLRTIRRLKAGKNWQCDHIKYQSHILVFFILTSLYVIFHVYKVYIFDLVTLAACVAGVTSILIAAIGIAVMASYLPSLLFVYIFIIKRFQHDKPLKSNAQREVTETSTL